MAKAKNVPWLMWGSEVGVTIPALVVNPPGGTQFNPQQLVALDYGRPDTWSFLFVAKILAVRGVNPINVSIFFDVTAGLGRSASQLLGRAFSFESFNFSPVVPGDLTKVKWSTTVILPAKDDSLATPPIVTCDHIPAQTLNINARIVASATVADTTFDCSVAAYVAPRSHVRPDWYSPEALGSGER